jgi:hypothetical protein
MTLERSVESCASSAKPVLPQSRGSRMVYSGIGDFTWPSRRAVRGLGKANSYQSVNQTSYKLRGKMEIIR